MADDLGRAPGEPLAHRRQECPPSPEGKRVSGRERDVYPVPEGCVGVRLGIRALTVLGSSPVPPGLSTRRLWRADSRAWAVVIAAACPGQERQRRTKPAHDGERCCIDCSGVVHSRASRASPSLRTSCRPGPRVMTPWTFSGRRAPLPQMRTRHSVAGVHPNWPDGHRPLWLWHSGVNWRLARRCHVPSATAASYAA